MLWDTNLILVKSIPGEHRKTFDINFNYSVCMNIYYTVCCSIYVRLHRQCCETHGHIES